MNPVTFSLLPVVRVLAPLFLNHYDGCLWRMGSYWFLEPLLWMSDMKRVFCLTHVLQFAFLVLDEVDDIPHLFVVCMHRVRSKVTGSGLRTLEWLNTCNSTWIAISIVDFISVE